MFTLYTVDQWARIKPLIKRKPFVLHSLQSYAAWTMKQKERDENNEAKDGKKRFNYAYALGYFRKALKEMKQTIKIPATIEHNYERRYDADTTALDLAQDAYILWHESQVGKRVRLSTRLACRNAASNYWRKLGKERFKEKDLSHVVNPNTRYLKESQTTAQRNRYIGMVHADGSPDRVTLHLDFDTADAAHHDEHTTTLIRMLRTGASQRDVANTLGIHEATVSRMVKELRTYGKAYWGVVRERGETIPQAALATIPYKAPKTFKPIAVVQSNGQTVLDHSPIRISEQRYSAQWREYAETFRNATDTSLRENVDNYGYTENDMANPMPNDNDSAFKGEIIYS